jgi:hypothetical protein
MIHEDPRSQPSGGSHYPKIYGQFPSSDLRDVTLKAGFASFFFLALCPQDRLAVSPPRRIAGLPEPSGRLPEGFSCRGRETGHEHVEAVMAAPAPTFHAGPTNASLVVLCRLGRRFGCRSLIVPLSPRPSGRFPRNPAGASLGGFIGPSRPLRVMLCRSRCGRSPR